jgi:hypothetical protein
LTVQATLTVSAVDAARAVALAATSPPGTKNKMYNDKQNV